MGIEDRLSAFIMREEALEQNRRQHHPSKIATRMCSPCETWLYKLFAIAVQRFR
jgi:hypothetical protein